MRINPCKPFKMFNPVKSFEGKCMIELLVTNLEKHRKR